MGLFNREKCITCYTPKVENEAESWFDRATGIPEEKKGQIVHEICGILQRYFKF